jgi:hypothetical protein
MIIEDAYVCHVEAPPTLGYVFDDMDKGGPPGSKWLLELAKYLQSSPWILEPRSNYDASTCGGGEGVSQIRHNYILLSLH